jgi:hypothetical protein
MKAFYIAGFALFLGLMGISPLFAIEPAASQVIAEHLEQALIYEQKAAEQDVLIADQKQKMVDYKATYRIDEERRSTGRIEAMEKHCEAVIKSAEKLKKEFLDFAAWHRKQAAELQKKSKVSSSKERNG